MSEKRHYVLTYMDGNQDRSKTYAIYQGELDDFPVKVAFWKDEYLIVPNWFERLEEAMEYIHKLEVRNLQEYYMVQERHYAQIDPRITTAKIIGTTKNDFPISPSRRKIQESGEPVVDVWTMYILGQKLAEQYAAAFNADVEAAKLVV
jgi:hypothetical protein